MMRRVPMVVVLAAISLARTSLADGPSDPREERIRTLERLLSVVREESERAAGAADKAELEADLSAERDRVRVLEDEVARLQAQVRADEGLRSAREAYQAAQAELLVVKRRLRDRELHAARLEADLERCRSTGQEPGDS